MLQLRYGSGEERMTSFKLDELQVFQGGWQKAVVWLLRRLGMDRQVLSVFLGNRE